MNIYPVPTIRLLRTKIAPTRRFIQFDLMEAREAKVWVDVSYIVVASVSSKPYHKVRVPTGPQTIRIKNIYVVQIGTQSCRRVEVVNHV